MKKNGILNAQLAFIIASIGHGDKLVLCDCGYPIPHNARLVDLSLTINIPRIIDTLKVILAELTIEGIIITNEMEARSPQILKEIKEVIPEGTKVEMISHDEFKRLNAQERNITFIKTGEATPFSNLILIAGVAF